MSSLSDDDSDSVCSEDSVFGADETEKGKKRSKSKLINEGKNKHLCSFPILPSCVVFYDPVSFEEVKYVEILIIIFLP